MQHRVRNVTRAMLFAMLAAAYSKPMLAAEEQKSPHPSDVEIQRKLTNQPQIRVTKEQLFGVVRCWKEVNSYTDVDYSLESPARKAEMDRIARKHGFADFSQFGDVSGSINLAFQGCDPVSRKYLGRVRYVELQIARVSADWKIPAEQKSGVLEQLKDELQLARQYVSPPPKYQSNIELVAKHYDELKEVMQHGE